MTQLSDIQRVLLDSEGLNFEINDQDDLELATYTLAKDLAKAFVITPRAEADMSWHDRVRLVLKRHTEEMTAKGPEACKEYLVSLGIYNEDGSLTKEYGG